MSSPEVFPSPKYKWDEFEEDELKECETSSGYKTKIFEVDGVRFPFYAAKAGFLPDLRTNLPRIKQMEIRNDDIIICAYPKAGTQWLWEVTKMLVKKKPEYEKQIKTEAMLEFHHPEDFDALPSPRVFNTHLFFRQIPQQMIEKKCKIIFIQRNAKDVAVSYFNHKKLMFKADPLKWEDYVELFATEYIAPYTDWYTYTLDWEKVLAENTNLSVHYLYYEDLKKNQFEETKRLAEFLEVDCDDQLIKDVCEKCSFQNMKKASIEVKPELDLPYPAKVNKEIATGLFRKGQVGDWKNWFTVAQNERFEAEYNERMKGSKLKFSYI